MVDLFITRWLNLHPNGCRHLKNVVVLIFEAPQIYTFFRAIGGFVKDRKWAEEAGQVKKMILEKNIQVTLRS